VTNFRSNDVSVIDTRTNTVIASVTVANGPQGIAVSPNGRRAYVAAISGFVSVIDTRINAVVATIDVGTQPQGVAVSRNGHLA
jgi:YVTN family beta-propeller protein